VPEVDVTSGWLGGIIGMVSRAREAPECSALDSACHMRYRSLARFAALLTGDEQLAAQIAADALAAVLSRTPDGSREDSRDQFRLRQQVIARSRRAARRSGHGPGTDWPALPVVRALQALTMRQREAVVLTYYLDLPEAEAAAVMGASQRVMHALLADAWEALRAVTAEESDVPAG
jgi:DNA-directed RNA polymerase specialized sigma24 family protein